MVVDGKLFKPGNALPDNTLFVVEQIPGLMVGKDISIELAEGHFGSFNVPYHHEIYVASGYPYIDKLERKTTYTEYQMAPRAQIFRRDQTDVKDIESFKVLMRSNSTLFFRNYYSYFLNIYTYFMLLIFIVLILIVDYKTDPLSGGDPMNAICSRGDLRSSPYADGGYDTKVSSVNMLTNASNSLVMAAYIINGPTSQNLPPFVWSTSGLTDRHVGHPDVFKFEFEYVTGQAPVIV